MKCNIDLHNELKQMECLNCPFCNEQQSTKNDIINNEGTNVEIAVLLIFMIMLKNTSIFMQINTELLKEQFIKENIGITIMEYYPKLMVIVLLTF